MTKNSTIRAIIAYLSTALLSLIILTVIMRLWKADFSVPLTFNWDSVYSSALVKGVIDNGWYLRNDFIGAPFGQDFHDFESLRGLLYLIVKALVTFISDFGRATNYFFIITFPLTAVSAMFTFRQLKISYPPAALGALLFAFLPYHFMRGIDHLFLSAYFVIPLSVLLALWLMDDKNLMFNGNGPLRDSLSLDKKTIIAFCICLLLATSGIYYSFFGLFFITIAGFSAYIWKKDRRKFLAACIFVLLILAVMAGSGIPKFYFQKTNGVNKEIAARKPVESEIYGLRITQLILPVTGHRLPFLAEIKERYNEDKEANETDYASIGLLSAVGFIILLVALVRRRKSGEDETLKLVESLSILNIAALLLATTGGFSAIIAYNFSPQIRAYNRISVYIAFFSITALIVYIDRFHRRLSLSATGRPISFTVIGLLLILGVLDQTTNAFVPKYQITKKRFAEQAKFVGEIESRLPEQSMIFQLPYVPYPESPPVARMTDYDHLASGYLHSKTLRWSYGGIRGRRSDLWQKQTTSKPVNEFIQIITIAGFKGVMIDRRGYEDNGENIEKEIEEVTKNKPLVSADKRYVFYDLREFLKSYRASVSKAEFDKAVEEAKFPVSLRSIDPR